MNKLDVYHNGELVNTLTVDSKKAYKEIAKIFLSQQLRGTSKVKVWKAQTRNGYAVRIKVKFNNTATGGLGEYVYDYTFENIEY